MKKTRLAFLILFCCVGAPASFAATGGASAAASNPGGTANPSFNPGGTANPSFNPGGSAINPAFQPGGPPPVSSSSNADIQNFNATEPASVQNNPSYGDNEQHHWRSRDGIPGGVNSGSSSGATPGALDPPLPNYPVQNPIVSETPSK